MSRKASSAVAAPTRHPGRLALGLGLALATTLVRAQLEGVLERPALKAHVKRVSPTLFEIERDAYIEAFTDPNLLFDAHGESVPGATKGQTKGFRITQIVKGSPYDILDIREQDIITHINGQKLETLAVVQELYAQAPGAKSFKVDLLRSGKKLSVTYRLISKRKRP